MPKTKSSSSSSLRAAGISPRASTRASTRASPRASTRASPRASTRASTRVVSPGAATRAVSPRVVSPRVVSPRVVSPSAVATFAAATAAKDTNRLHNLPVDVQTYIMKLAKIKKKNSRGKYELYKKIYYNRKYYMDWLDEIKRDGVDNKNRVRNPLREGSMIYTDKNGLYSKLWHLCMQIFQGSYDRRGVPEPVKRYYKKAQLKFFNKPPQPQLPPPQPSI
jgi:hypothetical protein